MYKIHVSRIFYDHVNSSFPLFFFVLTSILIYYYTRLLTILMTRAERTNWLQFKYRQICPLGSRDQVVQNRVIIIDNKKCIFVTHSLCIHVRYNLLVFFLSFLFFSFIVLNYFSSVLRVCGVLDGRGGDTVGMYHTHKNII